MCWLFLCIDYAKDPKDYDEDDHKDRKAKSQKKIDDLYYFFDFPISFFNLHAHWNILVLSFQKLKYGVEGDNREGVDHGKDHPDIYHLDVGSHG